MGRAVAPRLPQRFARAPARTRRQQRHDRAPHRRSRTGGARRSCSRPSARRASAARRCAGCSCTRASTTRSAAAAEAGLRSGADRQSARDRHAGRPADRQAAFDRMQKSACAGGEGGGRHRHRRRARDGRQAARRLLRAPGARRNAGADGRRAHETFAPILYVHALSRSAEAIRRTTPCRRACRRRSSPPICARPSCSCRPRGTDCGIANVNIGPAARRSAARSAARRKPAAAANPAPTAGRPICAARPTPSITRATLPLAQGVKFDVNA